MHLAREMARRRKWLPPPPVYVQTTHVARAPQVCSDLLPATTHTHTDQGSDQAYQVYLRASRHVQHDKPGS